MSATPLIGLVDRAIDEMVAGGAAATTLRGHPRYAAEALPLLRAAGALRRSRPPLAPAGSREAALHEMLRALDPRSPASDLVPTAAGATQPWLKRPSERQWRRLGLGVVALIALTAFTSAYGWVTPAHRFVGLDGAMFDRTRHLEGVVSTVDGEALTLSDATRIELDGDSVVRLDGEPVTPATLRPGDRVIVEATSRGMNALSADRIDVLSAAVHAPEPGIPSPATDATPLAGGSLITPETIDPTAIPTPPPPEHTPGLAAGDDDEDRDEDGDDDDDEDDGDDRRGNRGRDRGRGRD
jgi:hypothetical protein